jgi:hypothetical protein
MRLYTVIHPVSGMIELGFARYTPVRVEDTAGIHRDRLPGQHYTPDTNWTDSI